MLKILTDECVHQDLINPLKKEGLDILTVIEVNLGGASDDSIFNFAQKNKRILLTFDRGFGDIFRFNIKKSTGVVIVIIGKMKRKEIIRNTLTFLKSKPAKNLKGKLVIISRKKVRIKSF